MRQLAPERKARRPAARWLVAAGLFLLAGPAMAACPEGRSGYEKYQASLVFTPLVEEQLDARLCYPVTVFPKRQEGADGLRFISDDGLAWFHLSSRPNERRLSAGELAGEAVERIEEEASTVTYRRTTEDWFVLSGFTGERIYYLKTVLAEDGASIDTMFINFPKEQKPFYYDIVERMSWSYKPK
jgi:hypothetical protein